MGKSVKTYRSLVEGQAASVGKPETVKKRKPRSKPAATKLNKSDPDFYSKIGQISAQKRLKKQGTNYYSNLAKLSHPRASYNGGRKKKEPSNDE